MSKYRVINALRQFIPAFLEQTPFLNSAQRRAVRAIRECRTLALGWELYGCSKCGKEHFACHSCNHKACPQCGRLATKQWVERELSKLIKAPYFMVNFTLPAEFRFLFQGARAKEFFDAFFKTSAAALSEILADPRWLGAKTNGFTGVLHTWNQRLMFHPHIHYIVPGAGLDETGGFLRCRSPDYLVPVGALRKRFVELWLKLLKKKEIDIQGIPPRKKWGVYFQSFGAGNAAVKYLGTYVCRTAISDHRLTSCTKKEVTFRWKDRTDGNRIKQMSIPAVEFVERYLRHVLPRGLRSIRHYGFCHPAAKRKRERIGVHSGMDWLIEGDVKSKSDRKSNPKASASPYVCSRCVLPMTHMESVDRFGQHKMIHGRDPPATVGPKEQERSMAQ